MSAVRARASALCGHLLLILIRGYRAAISPWLPPSCRFTPTCSRYAETAVRRFGPWRGSWLAVRRLLRCHPWGGRGADPVPLGRRMPEAGSTATASAAEESGRRVRESR